MSRHGGTDGSGPGAGRGDGAFGTVRGATVLQVTGLSVFIPDRYFNRPVVDDVSFNIGPGEVIALVGESGSGKTVTAMSVAGLVSAVPGASVRGEVETANARRPGIIFQDPTASLNPVRTAAGHMKEVLEANTKYRGDALAERAAELIHEVGLPNPSQILTAFPHQLSVGMRQRLQVAIALAADPQVLIADEPTSALDPILQRQLLEMLRNLTRTRSLGTLLITHDLGAAAGVSDRVLVMYAGRIMEEGSAERILSRPANPYTRALLDALPGRTSPGEPIPVPPGRMPYPGERDEGCSFRGRCPYRRLRECGRPVPLAERQAKQGDSRDGQRIRHRVRCVLTEPLERLSPGVVE